MLEGNGGRWLRFKQQFSASTLPTPSTTESLHLHMTPLEFLFARLDRLNTQNRQQVDLVRFSDTLAMVCDADDPCGYCFLALLMRECEGDLHVLKGMLSSGSRHDLGPRRSAIRKICHRWTGRCAQLGLLGLEAWGRRLREACVREEPLTELRHILTMMEVDLERVRTALQYMHIY